jgi:hypothetical protein
MGGHKTDGDLPQLDVAVLRLDPEHLEGRVATDLVHRHQDALGLIDRGPADDGLAQLPVLLAGPPSSREVTEAAADVLAEHQEKVGFESVESAVAAAVQIERAAGRPVVEQRGGQERQNPLGVGPYRQFRPVGPELIRRVRAR